MTCRATTEGYLVNDQHYDTCAGEGCRGCWPCVPSTERGDPLEHCTARGRCTSHVDPGTLTCPRCMGKVRSDIRRIAALTALLPVAAVESGRIDSDAANLAGPAADVAGWSDRMVQARRELRERFGDDYEALDKATRALPDDDPEHPYAVLGRWQMMLEDDPRECYPVEPERITVAGAAAYLDRELGMLAQDNEQDFPLFAREVRGCLERVEQALAVAMLREQGAPCPACAERGMQKPPRLQMDRHPTDHSGAKDRWRCLECKTSWTEAEYRLRIGTVYLDHADRLTASQLKTRYRVSESTVRTWAQRGAVRKRGTDQAGRMLYDVDDVLKARDAEAAEVRVLECGRKP